MLEPRNIFIHGLSLTLRRLPALLWAYFFNLALAFLFSISLNLQLSRLLNHSLAAQRLSSGFDLGTIGETYLHLHEGPLGDAGAVTGHASIPLFLIVYFLLVPGTLFCYQTDAPARLGTLLQQGLLYFWRFVRITLLTLLISGLILSPLFFLQGKWADQVDDHIVGRSAFLLILAGNILLFLVASILRLYFDLVEVYTVQLGQHLRPTLFGQQAKPDRRVRYALAPAWRTLRTHFHEAWPIFLFLSLLGFAAVILTARISMHMLAQPRVWPTFLLAQLGLFLMLLTRFWQRGAETSLALQNPIPSPSLPPPVHVASHVHPTDPVNPTRIHLTLEPHTPPPTPTPTPTPEPISDPEPAPPSLDEPDPGVFHHDPTRPLIKPQN
ncbi:MAG TPA: hypothetical protein VNX17_01670 [Edaphobacter sp.]|jgi:hypothetical protein|nr:hypothetical protein [Edaphobacter sp.]